MPFPFAVSDLFRIFLPLCLLLLWLSHAQAVPIRVTSWRLTSSPGISQQQLQAAATALQQLHPDVILLQQVPNEQMCRQLAEALKPADYQVLVCSAFPNARKNAAAPNQVAILSKLPAHAFRAQTWENPKATNPPTGFVFAAIQTDHARLGLFCVHLDDALAETLARPQDRSTAQVQADLIQQWLDQVDLIRQGTTNRLEAAVLAGGFASSSVTTSHPNRQTRFAKKLLEAALDQVIEPAGQTESNHPTSNCLSARLIPNAENLPGIVLPLSPVTCDLDLGPSQPPPAPVVALSGSDPNKQPSSAELQVSHPPSPNSKAVQSHPEAPKVVQTGVSLGSLSNLPPRPPAIPVSNAALPKLVSSKDLLPQSNKVAAAPAAPQPQKTLPEPSTPLPSYSTKPAKMPFPLTWPLLTSVGIGLALLAFLGLRTRRQPCPSNPPTASSPAETLSSAQHGRHQPARNAFHSLPEVSRPGETPQTTSPSPDWQHRALAAEQRAEHAQALLRARLLPQVSQWLKQKLLGKLLSDRTHLLATQQAATLQALAVHERLTRIETQIQQQQQAYERRIDALTCELATAREENRQLIRAQIDQVKAEMEAARNRLR